MISILHNLFEFYKFSSKEINNGFFYIPKKEKQREEYWLVVKEDVDHLLEIQEKLFSDCKALCADASVDKNLSMLILWETDGKIAVEKLKERIMSIEEDPYLFKKYVLYFSPKEIAALKKEIGSGDISKFIGSKIVAREIFNEYKEKPYIQTWQSLLYRIAIKIPFLVVPIGESKGLQSLFEANSMAIEEKKLTKFNNDLMGKIDSFLPKEKKDISSVDLFNQLWPLLEGGSGGNQIKKS